MPSPGDPGARGCGHGFRRTRCWPATRKNEQSLAESWRRSVQRITGSPLPSNRLTVERSARGERMSRVRALVGTRKGAFVLTSDGKREKWDVSGPHFAGWEIFHMKGSPLDPNRIFASQTSSWFGQIIQRSDDGGKTWTTPGGEKMPDPYGPPNPGASNKFVYNSAGAPLTTHQWYDGTQHPW